MSLSLFILMLLMFGPLGRRFLEGGPLFMSFILISLLLSVFFIIRGFLSVIKKNQFVLQKNIRLATDSSLLGLVLGFLGSIIGLISGFDKVEAAGNVEPALLAGGLKVSLLTATFGLLSFVIARFGILVLRWFTKADEESQS